MQIATSEYEVTTSDYTGENKCTFQAVRLNFRIPLHLLLPMFLPTCSLLKNGKIMAYMYLPVATSVHTCIRVAAGERSDYKRLQVNKIEYE